MGVRLKDSKDISPPRSVEEGGKSYLVYDQSRPPSFSRMIHPMIPVLVANLINTGQSIIQ